jgi:molecular chaperone DnaK
MAEIAVGIDLGTSNSCVAVSLRGRVDVLPNAYGESTTASVVALADDGSITVGNAARANVIHDPANTIISAKRLIGRYFFSEEVKKAQAICSYDIVEGENHSVRIQARDEVFSLPEVGAMVLRELKSIAESRMGRPVQKAVVTVPAYFNDNQRQATKDAAKIAGLEVLRILNEPTAAALAYGFGRGLNQRVAIYDLGGGTFDISVLEIGDDVFEVLSTSGDTFLGGDDFDDRIIDLLADEFLASRQLNLRNDPYALEKLKLAAEGAKKTLSVDDSAEVRIPDVISTSDGESLSLERTLTTAEFASLIADLLQRTFKVCDEALQQAELIVRDLDGVILVGGPTRLPIVRAAVRDYFQQDPLTNVDPDEVVAMGAAIHAASLTESGADAYLLDVTPLSLQIGVAGGVTEPVIERNTPVPIEQTRTFTTFKDHQESVAIRVYQGEAREAEENELLGQFDFSGFDSGLRGEVEIDVTFEINTDGLVNVLARDKATGQEASTSITLSSGLSDSGLEDIMDRGVADRVATARTEPHAEAELIPTTPVPGKAPTPPPRVLPASDDASADLELAPHDDLALPIGSDAPPPSLETDADLSLDLVQPGDAQVPVADDLVAGGWDNAPPAEESVTTVNLGDDDFDDIDVGDFDLPGDEVEIETTAAASAAPDAELELDDALGSKLTDEQDFDEDVVTNVEGLFDMSGDEFTDDSESGA